MTDPVGVSDQQLTEWQRLSEEATAGPWRVRPDDAAEFYGHGEPGFDIIGGDGDGVIVAYGGPAEDGGPHVGALDAADAAFVVAAREAFPVLLAEVSRLQAENQRQAETIAALDDDADQALIDTAEAIEAESQAGDRIAAERDAALARVAAVEKLLDAAEEASLRPEPEDFEPIEVPWTVAVRAALSATPGEDGKR